MIVVVVSMDNVFIMMGQVVLNMISVISFDKEKEKRRFFLSFSFNNLKYI